MIKTRPSFLLCDLLPLNELLKAFVSGKTAICFSKPGICLKRSAQLTIIITLIPTLLIAIAFPLLNLINGRPTDWPLLVQLLPAPAIVMAPLCLTAFFFSYYLKAVITGRRIQRFIAERIPGASLPVKRTPSNFTMGKDGIEYEIAYTTVDKRFGPFALPVGVIIVATYFNVRQGSPYASDGKLLESDFKAYCEGKRKCQYLEMDYPLIYAAFRLRQTGDTDDVAESTDQMRYILQRFNLMPLFIVPDQSLRPVSSVI